MGTKLQQKNSNQLNYVGQTLQLLWQKVKHPYATSLMGFLQLQYKFVAKYTLLQGSMCNIKEKKRTKL